MNVSAPHCNVCNSTKTRIKFVKNGVNLMYCANCQFVFVHPHPTTEEQREWYEESYRNGVYKIHYSAEKLRKKINQRRFEEIKKYSPKGKILDIGCATGYFLDVAVENGLSTYGVEFSSEAAVISKRKHDVFNGILENAKYPDKFFDIITAYDVIEHVVDPNSTMKEVSKIIKPNGILILTTPDISSWHAKVMGKRWGIISTTEHLYYFSPHSIGFLLENNGFTIIEMRKDLKIFTLDNMFKMAEFYYPTIFKVYNLLKVILPKKFLHKERLFYFGDIFVVARKNSEK